MTHRVRWSRSGIGTPLALLAVAALLAALYAPTVQWLWTTWRVHPYYAHGPFVLPVAAALAWRQRTRLEAVSWAPGWPMLAAGLTLTVASSRMEAMPLSAAGLVLVVAALVGLVWGSAGLRALALPIALLAVAVPLPWVERLTPPLAAAVARAAAGAATAAGVAVERSGAQLAVGDGAFVVGAPCSGLRSVLALATVALVLAGLSQASPGRRAILLLAALPVALCTNWLRLTSLLLASHTFGAERGLVLFDGPAGALFFVAAVAILLAMTGPVGGRVQHTE